MDEYVIAFIDLLGSKSKIMGENSMAFFHQVQKLYLNTMSMFSGFDDGHIKIKIFSDNIIFAKK